MLELARAWLPHSANEHPSTPHDSATDHRLTFKADRSREENAAFQLASTTRTWAALVENGVEDGDLLPVEVFFYARSAEQANSVASSLIGMGDCERADIGVRGGLFRRKGFVITGVTNPVIMSEDALMVLTRTMLKIAEKHDAQFDGLGVAIG